ncbi:MAG: DegT/DnrJ/EryC1/StrS family aminotransferase [Phycisphaeraceae bacterium]
MSERCEQRLAIDGGSPIKTAPWGRGSKHPPCEAEAVRALTADRPRLPLAMGEAILGLRQGFRELFGIAHAVPTSSGTAAIHTALAAMGIAPGDEVITTPVTDHGTVIGIMQLDAVPVFADVKPDTAMIDAETIEPCITPRTRAILPVHYHGCPADMDGITALAQKHNLHVLEDAAQSWLAQWNGRLVGTIGDAGAFSMNESKHLSVGEGGLLITNHASLAAAADKFADKSYDRHSGVNRPTAPAMNYRLSEIAAAIGLEQLKRIESITRRRHEIGERIADALHDLAGVNMLRSPVGGRCTYWHGLLIIDPEVLTVNAKMFADALRAEGIGPAGAGVKNIMRWPLFARLNEEPSAFAGYRPPGLVPGRFAPESCPTAETLTERAVRFGINEFMMETDVDQTITAVHKVADWYTAQRTAVV